MINIQCEKSCGYEETRTTNNDVVNHPDHYNTGAFEVYDYIVDKLSPEELKGYIKGNVLKYVSRENYKGKTQDLRKAAWYLNRYLERMDLDCVSTADVCGCREGRRTDRNGTTALPPELQEKIYEELNNGTMTEPNDKEERWIRQLERQNDLLERLLDLADTTEQGMLQSILANRRFQKTVGECPQTGSTAQHV